MAAIAMSITASGVALAQVDVGANIGIAHLQWIMNGFILSFAALLLPFGSLADRYGERPVFLVGGVLFALATLVTVFASSLVILMTGRLLQGAGAALLAAAGPPALTSVFSEESERKRAFGYLGAGGGVGLTLGGFLAGVVSSAGGWRAAFALHLPFVIATVVIAVRGFHGKRGSRAGRFDWLGMILCGLCISAAMTFSISGGVQGWTAPFVVGTLIVAVLAGGAFVIVERKHPTPLIRLSTFHNQQFLLACLICVLFTTVWVAFFIYVPLNLRTVQARTGFDAGATMLALMVPALIMPMVASRLAQRMSPNTVMIGGFLLMSLGTLALCAGWSGELRRELEIMGLIVCGTGAGALYGLVDYLALTAVPSSQSGAASGAFNIVRLAGDALGSIVPGAVLLHTLQGSLAQRGGTDISHATMNELAAGRFAALSESGMDPTVVASLTPYVKTSFAAGMILAVQTLAAIAAFGIVAILATIAAAAIERRDRTRVRESDRAWPSTPSSQRASTDANAVRRQATAPTREPAELP